MTQPRIAFLGLGLMGSGMAGRLLAAGFPLAVFNRNAAKARPLVEAGARLATSPRDAAKHADVVISMVADDVASRALWLGENGALAGVPRGAVLIECSTLTVDWVKELASLAAARGCELLDAPVTGSRAPAAAGQLSFFVGGDISTLEKVRAVFAPMAKSLTHVGPTGSGALVKLINNFLCGVQVAALADAVALIEKAGLNRDQVLPIFTEGTPGSTLMKLLAPRMTARDYTPNFSLKLLTKDLGYALQEGEKHSVELATTAAALKVFQRAIAAGLGDQDMSAVVELLRKKTE
ncbi:MAG: NAD(P)-dependent oxidoreductase [Verrucomicrobia bacterium]|nr:MAG: NAD(P)-dependent oxidoreductase [Verrucomicrobiota bacterium]